MSNARSQAFARTGVVAVAAAFVCINYIDATSDPPPSQADAAKSKTVFLDDFAGPGLDRSKWNVRVTGETYNNEQQAYVDSPETIHIANRRDDGGAANGALVLEARYRAGFTTPEKK